MKRINHQPIGSGDPGRSAPPGRRKPTPSSETARLLHELQVHQVELQVQNEALLETQARLEQERKNYRDLFDFAPLGYFTVDLQGTVLQTNQAGAALLREADPSWTLGRGLDSFLPPADRAVLHRFLSALSQGGRRRTCEVVLPRAGGHGVRLELQGVRREPGVTCLVMATDITGRHAIQEGRRLLAQELEQRVQERTAQLESANRDLAAFAHMVSHEMRAPIARMEGYGRMLQDLADPGTPPRVRDIAGRMERGSRRMRAVIDGLLQLTRVSLDKACFETVDLSRVAWEAIEDLAQEGLRIPKRLSIAEGIQVEGDRRLLSLCLRNLLGNAVKFSAGVPRPEVALAYHSVEGRRMLAVRDNGAGFDPALAGGLFQPFGRLHPEGLFEGLGIGLAMVRMIVDKHGWRIRAESAVGGGSVFYVELDP